MFLSTAGVSTGGVNFQMRVVHRWHSPYFDATRACFIPIETLAILGEDLPGSALAMLHLGGKRAFFTAYRPFRLHSAQLIVTQLELAALHGEETLDEALDESFPASDPIAVSFPRPVRRDWTEDLEGWASGS